MSAPYLAVVSPARRESAPRREAVGEQLARAGWRSAFRKSGLEVWIRPERAAQLAWLQPEQCLIVGRSAPRSGPLSKSRIDRPTVERARFLVASRWGAYLAVLREGEDRWSALREPGAGLDAFTWQRDGLAFLASDLDLVPPRLWPAELAIDWNVVAGQLRSPTALTWRSALQGVHAILPGDVQALGEPTGQPAWRPHQFLPEGREAGPDVAMRLADEVVAAVGALAAGYDRILTELSGGLDSSIVNTAVAAAGFGDRVVGAVHYRGDRRESDERAWAAAVAERWGLPLVVAEREVGTIDPEADFRPFATGARPPVGVLDAWRDRDMASRMADHGADALFTGMGGDAVLFQMPTARVLSDLWAARGWRSLGHPMVGRTARWLRRSVWSVCAEALDRRRAGSDGLDHPWLNAAGSAPPAKRLQILGLVTLQRAYGRSRRAQAGDLVHPLISTPVMETCLRIQSWELVRGGRDRGLAREAFADWLPEAVTRRTSKGGLTSLFSRRVAASADVLKAYLLDGALADAGLLDRPAIEQALDPDHLIWRADGVSLVTVAAIEAWVRHWQTRVPDSARARRPARATA